jgi:predicted dehydrogenase
MRAIRLAICDTDEASRASATARLRGVTVEKRPEDCDAEMFVRSPVSGEIESLLAGGTHVLLVADPCPSWDRIETLSRAARAAGAHFLVANPDRYLPSRRLIRQQFGTALGRPGLIRLHHWQPADGTTDAAGLPDPLLRDLDVTLWLAGRRPDRVYAVERRADGRYVQVHLGFPGGAMALLDFTDRLPPGDGYQSLSVIASSGAAYADDHQNVQLLYRGGHPRAVRTGEQAGLLAAIAQEFVDAIGTGRDLVTANVTAWKDVFAVADAVRQSLASGRAVAVEER